MKKHILSYVIQQGKETEVHWDKNSFLEALSEKIDEIEKSGQFEHFDISILPNNY